MNKINFEIPLSKLKENGISIYFFNITYIIRTNSEEINSLFNKKGINNV